MSKLKIKDEAELAILKSLSFFEKMDFSKIVLDLDNDFLKKYPHFSRVDVEKILTTLERKGLVKKCNDKNQDLYLRTHPPKNLLEKIKIFLGILSIIFILNLNAKINKLESNETQSTSYTFIEFCQSMKAKNLLLINPISNNEIECFNEKFNVTDFCLKKIPNTTDFTRGFAVTKEKKVYCENARSVTLNITCDSYKIFCSNPNQSCEKLSKIYAYNLELLQASKIEDNLNCYFTKKEEGNINELLEKL